MWQARCALPTCRVPCAAAYLTTTTRHRALSSSIRGRGFQDFHANGGESMLLCQNDGVQTAPHARCVERSPVTPESKIT
jgi:hypothetical protein